MTWDRKTAPAIALALLECVEGCRLTAYLDSVGYPTIGVGSRIMPNGAKVRIGDAITQPQADAMLAMQCEKWALVAASVVTVPLTETMAAALISFVHNLGVNALPGSMIAKMLNAGRPDLAWRQLGGWVLAGGQQSLGLMRRRECERMLASGDVAGVATAWAQASRMDMAAGQSRYETAFTDARTWGWTEAHSPPAVTVSMQQSVAEPMTLERRMALRGQPAPAPAPQPTADALDLEFNPPPAIA